jgi:hypothetical protein
MRHHSASDVDHELKTDNRAAGLQWISWWRVESRANSDGHTNDNEDGGESEEDDGVDKNGGGVDLQDAELCYVVALPRHLKQEAWGEQHHGRSFPTLRLIALLMLQLQ